MSELRYNKPAQSWLEALPIGNGRIGGMVYGGIYNDRIQINEETLWSGQPGKDKYQYNKKDLEELRRLVAEREYSKASEFGIKMLPEYWSDAYLTLGSLEFELLYDFIHKETFYQRSLDMSDGICRTEYSFVYDTNAINIKKEYFTSFADDVMVFRFSSDWQGFSVFSKFTPYIKSTVTVEGDTLVVRGKCPYEVRNDSSVVYDDRETVNFCAKLKVISSKSKTLDQGNLLINPGLGDMTAIFSIGTSFNGFDKMPESQGKDAEAECDRKLNAALGYTYEELKSRHIKAYSKEYGTTSIEFDGWDPNLPTDERIIRVAHGEQDPKLISTLYEYGKYLLLCSSRKGGQPATLQGIWTRRIFAPWRSNYTMNINTQMNYWAAEQCGLPDCHMPLMKMLRELSTKGNNYGMRGWYSCHNSDLWRFNIETGNGQYSIWQIGGIWTCRHIYEHFMFTMDTDFLREYWDVLVGAEEFIHDFMITDENGYLTTCPSTSPENVFHDDNGNAAFMCSGSGMDISVISDFYKNLAELAPYIGKDPTPYEETLKKIRPLKIGSDGRLLEWNEEFEETEKGHRHISHLIGYFPCHLYGEDSPYYDAMKKSLEFRLAYGGGHTGWSNAWIANMYVRMKDSKNAYKYLVHMFEKSMYGNMFDAHSPFQIDGNFGICSAITEMLVQSHRNGVIELLPCIPEKIHSGTATDICARGGYKVSFKFRFGRVTEYSVRDKNGKECSEELLAEGKLKIR